MTETIAWIVSVLKVLSGIFLLGVMCAAGSTQVHQSVETRIAVLEQGQKNQNELFQARLKSHEDQAGHPQIVARITKLEREIEKRLSSLESTAQTNNKLLWGIGPAVALTTLSTIFQFLATRKKRRFDS